MAGGHGGIQCSAVEICLLSHLVMHLGFGNLLFFLIIGNVLRTVMSKGHGTVKKTMISLLKYLDYARLLFHWIMDRCQMFLDVEREESTVERKVIALSQSALGQSIEGVYQFIYVSRNGGLCQLYYRAGCCLQH